MNISKAPEWVLSTLSTEQQTPLAKSNKNASILAAAGSGKTRTLVFLLLTDLANGILARNIIAFTFTEKAAEELSARIYSIANEHLPGVDLTGMFVGTIHQRGASNT